MARCTVQVNSTTSSSASDTSRDGVHTPLVSTYSQIRNRAACRFIRPFDLNGGTDVRRVDALHPLTGDFRTEEEFGCRCVTNPSDADGRVDAVARCRVMGTPSNPTGSSPRPVRARCEVGADGSMSARTFAPTGISIRTPSWGDSRCKPIVAISGDWLGAMSISKCGGAGAACGASARARVHLTQPLSAR